MTLQVRTNHPYCIKMMRNPKTVDVAILHNRKLLGRNSDHVFALLDRKIEAQRGAPHGAGHGTPSSPKYCKEESRSTRKCI